MPCSTCFLRPSASIAVVHVQRCCRSARWLSSIAVVCDVPGLAELTMPRSRIGNFM